METELYKILKDKLIASGMSMRGFCEANRISRNWFISFMSPKTPFRFLRIKTISDLHKNLGIDVEVCEEYNKWAFSRKEN